MPIVRIDIQSGKTTQYKRTLLHGVREAIATDLGVAHDRIMQRIVESPREHIDVTDVRSDRLTIIEITMLPRTREAKDALYRGIANRLGIDPGISAHDLVVLVNDPDAECFFLNGRMQCEGATPFVPEEATAPESDEEPTAEEPTAEEAGAQEPAEEPAADELAEEPES